MPNGQTLRDRIRYKELVGKIEIISEEPLLIYHDLTDFTYTCANCEKTYTTEPSMTIHVKQHLETFYEMGDYHLIEPGRKIVSELRHPTFKP